jgi:hypothetical protein
MNIKFGLTMVALAAILNSGCTAQQVAQFEHDLQQSQQNANNRQRACATAADREWNLYSGAASASQERSVGSGMYEYTVTAQNRSGICTVSETGMVRGVMSSGGNSYGGQSGSNQGGSDYDRGCADAKSGSYDRSGHASRAYEDGWNACRGGSSNNSPSSDYDRGCSDAKSGSYDRSGNASQDYENGWNACR